MTLWEERAARNEVVFRRVNEEVVGLGQGTASVLNLVCECSDAACIERIEVALDDYEAVRAHPRRFLVRPGHERDEIERVVDRREGYLVVEKTGDAGDVARRTDPRP
jgi:hypothetical protein